MPVCVTLCMLCAWSWRGSRPEMPVFFSCSAWKCAYGIWPASFALGRPVPASMLTVPWHLMHCGMVFRPHRRALTDRVFKGNHHHARPCQSSTCQLDLCRGSSRRSESTFSNPSSLQCTMLQVKPGEALIDQDGLPTCMSELAPDSSKPPKLSIQ